MNEGWIKIYRKLLEWEWFNDAKTIGVFTHILLSANWENKNWNGIVVKRGSFITSIKNLATKTNLSVQQTRSVLTNIQKTGELTIKTTNKYTLITVNKYDDYQTNNKQITNKQQTNNKQITTTKEYKNIRILDKSNGSNRNGQVDFVLKEFERVTGFRPTDKFPRRVAWNFIQRSKTEIKSFGKDPDDETIQRFTTKYFDWVQKQDWIKNCEKLETIKLKLVKYLDLFGGQKNAIIKTDS